jgi:hypothetical protein
MFGFSPIIIILGLFVSGILIFSKKNRNKKNKINTDKEMLTATKAFELLIQVTADITDKREEAEKLGFIKKSMTNNQAMGTLLAQYILMDDYEYNYGPQIMFSLLKTYCDNDILESFVNAYYVITKYRNISQIPLSQLESQQFNAVINIKEFAEQGMELGWQVSWCPFKEPYKTQWINGFIKEPYKNKEVTMSQYDDIVKLADLKEKGLLTEQEFEIHKNKLLNQANNEVIDNESISEKSRLTATLLCFFLGIFGVHRFYAGKIGTGILMIFTLGGYFIWAIIDFIDIASGKFKDSEGKIIKNWE